MDLRLREAEASDAAEMSGILGDILTGWNSDRPRSSAHVLKHYITHPDRLSCCVAIGGGAVLGFQSLKRASAGNPYGVTEGWGIIGTYVDAAAAGRGVGRALFSATSKVARAAKLTAIDATIGARNTVGLAYYDALGFRTYRHTPDATCKMFPLVD